MDQTKTDKVVDKGWWGFHWLNITQFLGVVNDNLFKLLLIFFLVRLEGQDASPLILSLAGAIFVIPFLLFSMPSGVLADRMSKRTIIILTKCVELATAILGLIGFIFVSPMALYAALFLLATESAILGPSKYGIVPELVSRSLISRANGYLSSGTFLAIIVGTSMAGPLVQLVDFDFVIAGSACVLIAFIGFICSWRIPHTRPVGTEKMMQVFFLGTIWSGIKRAQRVPCLFSSMMGSAFFLFVGGFAQLNVLPFAVHCMGLSDVQGSYLFLITALGIGCGSLIAGRLSKGSVHLGLVPIGALGMSISLLVIGMCPSFTILVIALFSVGGFGGIYLVPQDSYIQVASPAEDRGENVAINNFTAFVGVLIASGMIYLFGEIWNLSPARGFTMIGIVTLLFGAIITIPILKHLNFNRN